MPTLLGSQPSFFRWLPQRPEQDTSSAIVLSLGRILWKISSCLSILKILVQYRGIGRFFSCVKKKKISLPSGKVYAMKAKPQNFLWEEDRVMCIRKRDKEISQKDNRVVLGDRIEACFGICLFVFLHLLTLLNKVCFYKKKLKSQSPFWV